MPVGALVFTNKPPQLIYGAALHIRQQPNVIRLGAAGIKFSTRDERIKVVTGRFIGDLQ